MTFIVLFAQFAKEILLADSAMVDLSHFTVEGYSHEKRLRLMTGTKIVLWSDSFRTYCSRHGCRETRKGHKRNMVCSRFHSNLLHSSTKIMNSGRKIYIFNGSTKHSSRS